MASTGRDRPGAGRPPRSACACAASANAAATTARAIDAILDEALIAHLGIVDADGQPLVIPTLHARRGDVVYCHGAVASRTLRALAAGAPACLTVSLLDGLVLARSAMHHSANYRSVMLLGTARAVRRRRPRSCAALRGDRRAHRPRALGRRAPAERERAEGDRGARDADRRGLGEGPQRAAARRRGGLRAACWAGVIPLATTAQAPVADPRLRDGHRGAGLRERLPAAGRRVTAQVGRGVHRAPARRLHLEQLERPGRAGEQQALPSRATTPAPTPSTAAAGSASAARRTPSSLPVGSSARAPMCGAARARAARARRPARAGSSRRSAATIFSA